MTTWTIRSLMILTLLVCSVAARAGDVPADASGAAGIKELPGTIKKDVTGAVKHDVGMGGGVGGAKADDGKAGAKKAPAGDADKDADDAGDNEDGD
jgi:hypothetical protein